mmetsp:Transcript_71015/g.230543  ORF Transcript_71015/g.230543 Transcript_71015/m.230543 type:complete len:473 (-) Transcript_71015:559-1977(-)
MPPQQSMRGHKQTHGGKANTGRLASQGLLTVGLSGRVLGHRDDAHREEQGMHEPDAVSGAEDAPERVHLTVRLRRRRLQRCGPVQARERLEAPAGGLLEEPCAILQDQGDDEALRIEEELIPIVVVRDVRGEIIVEAFFEFFLVPVVLVDVHIVVPLVEDNVVYWADHRRKEPVAPERSPLLGIPLGSLALAVELVQAQGIGGDGQFSDEVDELGHEADVAGLTPDQEVGGHLCKFHVQLRASLGHVRGLVFLEPCPPAREAFQHVNAEVADGLLQEVRLVDGHLGLDRSISNHGNLRSQQREQVFILVLHVVHLEVERLMQGFEQPRRGFREVLGPGQHPEGRADHEALLQLRFEASSQPQRRCHARYAAQGALRSFNDSAGGAHAEDRTQDAAENAAWLRRLRLRRRRRLRPRPCDSGPFRCHHRRRQRRRGGRRHGARDAGGHGVLEDSRCDAYLRRTREKSSDERANE